jgi:hypothetical protein
MLNLPLACVDGIPNPLPSSVPLLTERRERPGATPGLSCLPARIGTYVPSSGYTTQSAGVVYNVPRAAPPVRVVVVKNTICVPLPRIEVLIEVAVAVPTNVAAPLVVVHAAAPAHRMAVALAGSVAPAPI